YPAADTWGVDSGLTSAANGESDAVQTVQLYLQVLGKSVAPQVTGSPTVYFDTLSAEQYSTYAYDAAEGALMEKPSDCAAHWVEAIGGATPDAASFALSETNLGSNILAVDMRTLTPGDWKAGLAGLGFLSRANMIPAEVAAGTVYRMLTAESNYDFPAADRTLTVWQTFSEAGPMEREVWTRFSCLYDYNAATAAGNEASYEGFLKASEDGTDLSNPTLAEMTTGTTSYGSMESPPIFLGGINDE
ncbi:unnamed protein product, partial [marine sediment metagenome]